MPFPSGFKDCLLRRILTRWAIRFTPDEALQVHLTEKTITETLRKFPSKDDDAAIDAELFATMRRLALEEFGMIHGAPKYPTNGETSQTMKSDQ